MSLPFPGPREDYLKSQLLSVSKAPTLPTTQTCQQMIGQSQGRVTCGSTCSLLPPRQGSPALSHAHAIWVIWSSHYRAHPIPVGCHSDNTPSDSSRAEAAIGKSLVASPVRSFLRMQNPKSRLGLQFYRQKVSMTLLSGSDCFILLEVLPLI